MQKVNAADTFVKAQGIERGIQKTHVSLRYVHVMTGREREREKKKKQKKERERERENKK